jgi:hypothetical protein
MEVQQVWLLASPAIDTLMLCFALLSGTVVPGCDEIIVTVSKFV